MSDLPLTPFTRIIESAGSENYSWFDFNGFKFADIVRDPVADVSAGRNGVAFQDVSPMMKFLVKGKDAPQFLDLVSTRKLSHLKPGRVAYFLMVNEDGFVRDDGTAYRLAEDEYLIQSVSNLTRWLEGHKGQLDVAISEVQARWAEISIYGRQSAAFLKAAGIEGLETLKPFDFRWITYDGVELMLSRTGFSGGLGYELLIPWDDAESVLKNVLAAGGAEKVTFTGNFTGVTLRLDIGFLIPGWDFPVPGGEAADPDAFRTPYDMGWDWLVQLDNREDFIGKRALSAIKESGPRFAFFALLFDGTVDPASLPGSAVRDASGKDIGHVIIAGYSASIEKFVAFCNVAAGSAAAGEQVMAGPEGAPATLSAFPLIEIPERSLTPPPGI
jgi:aminomethyltransferase